MPSTPPSTSQSFKFRAPSACTSPSTASCTPLSTRPPCVRVKVIPHTSASYLTLATSHNSFYRVASRRCAKALAVPPLLCSRHSHMSAINSAATMASALTVLASMAALRRSRRLRAPTSRNACIMVCVTALGVGCRHLTSSAVLSRSHAVVATPSPSTAPRSHACRSNYSIRSWAYHPRTCSG